eukprot:TRINITY_DN168_c0_g1_i1.p1 TRINITY_DN168_c0_g1~~TRINITY_DN168_c0_g1_i1.p1  ORF type:complete len:188 (+),score=63.05 TRINITY_DN168_c0_g1_i1:68-565(+)
MAEDDGPRDKGAVELKADEIETIREVFDLYKLGNEDAINGADIPICLQALGFNPSLSEAAELQKQGKLNFAKFLELCKKKRVFDFDEDRAQIKRGFDIFDKSGHGFVSAIEFKHIITHLGEALTEAEAEIVMKAAHVDGEGQINLDEFLSTLTGNTYDNFKHEND